MTAKQQSTESGGGLRTVTLTADQWNTLYFYLLTSTKYRNGEIEAWERLALEKRTRTVPQSSSTPPTMRVISGIRKRRCTKSHKASADNPTRRGK